MYVSVTYAYSWKVLIPQCRKHHIIKIYYTVIRTKKLNYIINILSLTVAYLLFNVISTVDFSSPNLILVDSNTCMRRATTVLAQSYPILLICFGLQFSEVFWIQYFVSYT